MKSPKTFFGSTVLLLFLWMPHAHGEDTASLKGEFKFTSRPPKLALIYFTEDHSASEAVKVDQKGKKFTQKLYVGTNKEKMAFLNSDTVDHNIFAQDPEAGVQIDVGLMKPGLEVKEELSWAEGRVVKISCKIHPKMRSYIANVSSKYYTVIEFEKKDQTRTFEIKDVPSKFKKVRIWMSGYEDIDVEVEPKVEKKVPLERRGQARGELSLRFGE